MKELLSKRFWRDVTKTFYEALEGPPPKPASPPHPQPPKISRPPEPQPSDGGEQKSSPEK